MTDALLDALRPPSPETQAERIRTALSADAYGATWCLTDILRLEDRSTRSQILHVLRGAVRSGQAQAVRFDPARRVVLSVELRTVDGLPLDMPFSRPIGPPQIQTHSGAGDLSAIPVEGHYHPGQQGTVYERVGPRLTVPLVSELPTQSALWLLHRYGWRAREHGRENRRFIRWAEKVFEGGAPKTIDQPPRDLWRLVEVAFEHMHPDMAPSPVSAPAVTPPATSRRGEARAAAA